MSLVIDEQVLTEPAELALGANALPISCQITVEWLRGIAEPTWYGFFEPLDTGVQVLPGGYRLRICGREVQILLRRPVRGQMDTRYPFWGIGVPPIARPVPSPAT